jgi:hypothetical protein
MKEIKIVYQPGFGGHFLTYLFSLDPSTVPHLAKVDVVSERLRYYDFKNTKKFNHWSQFHFVSSKRIYKRDDQILITCSHPTSSLVYDPAVTYYIVNLSYSDFANFWLVKTKEYFGNFPVLYPDDFEIEMKFREEHNPQPISIDCFLDPSTWQDEYRRVSSLMGIPLQLEAAEQLYQSWYDIRVAPIKEEFDNLPPDQRQLFLTKRQQDEIEQPSKHFWN